MRSLTLRAPAKINLQLHVHGRRSDGYHELSMLMVKLALADEIVFNRLPAGIEFSASGEQDEGMHFDSNLAVRAVRALQFKRHEEYGVNIQLRKKIPIGAGLGGGSSDAAAVLRGLNDLWGLGLSSAQLAEIGITLGADVPFFCYDGSAIVEGVGEEVTPLGALPKLHLLLINPGFAVSTKWAFETYAKGVQRGQFALTAKGRSASECQLFQGVGEICTALHNDLEAVTIPAYPEIADIKKFLIGRGARGALMSGSGPTVFGIFEDTAVRDRAMESVANPRWRCFATETLG